MIFRISRWRRFCKWLLVSLFVSLFSIACVKKVCASTIRDVQIQGNKTIESEAIINLMSSKVHTNYNPSQISSDIASIYNSGFFENVIIDRTLKDNETTLIVRVIEKPSVNDVLIVGSSVISDSTLKEKLLTKKFDLINYKKLLSDVKTIKQAYIEKGYYLANVVYELKPLSQGVIDVYFKIQANHPVKIQSVDFIGNNFFSDSELQEGMISRPHNWTSLLTSEGTFKDEFILRDQQYLSYFYRDNGFAEASITHATSVIDDKRENIKVSYHIEEGQRYNFGSIKISGELLEGEAQLLEKLRMKTGELFRVSFLSQDIDELQRIYGDKGYAFATIEPLQYIDRQKHVINNEFKITKGSQAYFGSIKVFGNSKTFDNVIKRELTFWEGLLYNGTKVIESQNNLEKLGYFESVSIVKDLHKESQTVNIRVLVKEKSTGQLQGSIGAGPDSDAGGFQFIGNASYADTNLLGRGYGTNLSFKLSPSNQKKGDLKYSFGLSFANPNIYDSPWGYRVFGEFSHSTDIVVKNAPIVYRNDFSFGLSLGREITRDIRLTAGYQISYDKFKTDSRDNSDYIKKFYQDGFTEILNQTISIDKTNSFTFPTSGYSFIINNSIASKYTVGQNYFGELIMVYSHYYPVNITDKFKTNFRFTIKPCFLYQLSKNKYLPSWKWFRLGDLINMKAYANHPISETRTAFLDPVNQKTAKNYIGGNRMLFSSLEYFIPVIPEANLRFVSFAEAGTVLDEKYSFSINKLKYDIGMGFRWTTPIAQFRFEWAWPIKNGKLGPPEFIFMVGPDNANSYINTY